MQLTGYNYKTSFKKALVTKAERRKAGMQQTRYNLTFRKINDDPNKYENTFETVAPFRAPTEHNTTQAPPMRMRR